jgi:chorismate mutase
MAHQLDIIPFKEWFGNQIPEPVFIAGPCSAESEEQIISTATAISKIPGIGIFRAGIWKPRTRPGVFEGVGKIGLEWLKKAKEKTGLLIAVEVAKKEHIDAIKELPGSVDILWIGARTTANPFSVQEIAENLKDIDMPVLIKNPINPDFDLWVGALERFNKVGIKKLAAIHRGFSNYNRSKYRNLPMWEFPIELKLLFPQLPVINDPSHIAGNTRWIIDIAQEAIDLNMDGLMIESHINPKNALSDAKQQLTPNELEEVLSKLKFRRASENSNSIITDLEQFRYQIDSIDQQIIELISRRKQMVEKIAWYKKDKDITIFQLKRWRQIVTSRLDFASSLNLDPEFTKALLQLIHKNAIDIQRQIMNPAILQNKINRK